MKHIPEPVTDMLHAILADSRKPTLVATRLRRAVALMDGIASETEQALGAVLNETIAALKDEGATMTVTLSDALKSSEVKEHIQSEVTSATAEAKAQVATLTDTKEQLESDLQDKEAQVAEEQTRAQDLATKVTGLLIDNIVSAAVTLQKPEIDPENLEDSTKEYTESLRKRKLDSLEDKWKDIQAELQAFQDAPTEGVDRESAQEDGRAAPSVQDTEDPDEKDTKQNNTLIIKDNMSMKDVFKQMFTSKEASDKDTKESQE